MNPSTSKGAIFFIGMGFGGALIALLISQLAPQIIPSRAAGVAL